MMIMEFSPFAFFPSFISKLVIFSLVLQCALYNINFVISERTHAIINIYFFKRTKIF